MPKPCPATLSACTVWVLTVVIAVLLTALFLWGYERSLLTGGTAAQAGAMVVLTGTGALATALLAGAATRKGRVVGVATLFTSGVLVLVPWLARGFGLAPLPWDDGLLALCGGLLAVAGPIWLARFFQSIGVFRQAFSADFRQLTGAREPGAAAKDKTAARPLTGYAWLSVLAAVATMVLKTSAYLLTGSVALLSDAAESLVNLAGAGFAVVVLTVAARPADESHPFGHGRAEYFSSGFTGALILLAAFGIVWTAVERLVQPRALADLDIGLAIAIIATLINFAVARVLLSAGRRHDSITLEADGQHLMTDVWTTGAVLLGLGGVVLTGWLWLDAMIAILAALNIVRAGAQLIVRSLSGLLGPAIPSAERAEVETILDTYRRQGVRFHDLRAHSAGSQRLITVHVLVPGAMTVQQGHDLVQMIENDLRSALPNLLIVTHLEPLDDPASFAHEIV